ncbi:SoxR reducing system RseC family protein [Pistricoccus aurantiacus]|uniref:SoxR reducing system RseC family protein n=1 Tax=Pistricoccus aurantiacus TaxID=1883414 RepID=A0A5B8SVI3_9GAMM|nr:SoxR reducing system RseC family protein [Pistricoccus aurantiacus]
MIGQKTSETLAVSHQERVLLDGASLMLESARVVAPFSGGAWVSIESRLACQGCAAKRGCGSGLLARWQDNRSRRFAVRSETPLAAGQRIQLAVPATHFLQSAVIVYLLPLISALAAGVLAEILLPPSHWGVPAAFLAGLAGGVGLFKCCAGRLSRHLSLRVIDS